jgi:hypothetical protein
MARVGTESPGAAAVTLADLPVADVGTVEPSRGVRWREVAAGLGWKRIVAAALGIFVLVMGVILAFEISAGRSLSSYTGGSDTDGARTSLSVFGDSGGDSSGGDARRRDAKGRDDRQDSEGPAGSVAERSQDDVGASTSGLRDSDSDIGTGTRTGTRTGSGPSSEPVDDVAPEPEPTPQPSEDPDASQPEEPEPTLEPEPTPEPSADPAPSAPPVQQQVDAGTAGQAAG